MKRILLSLTVIVVAASAAIAGTLAYFTSESEITNNTIATGTLELTTSPTSSLISYGNIYPGWHYQDEGHWGSYIDGDPEADIRVTNTGSLPLKYRVKANLTGDDNSDELLETLLVKLSVNKGTGGGWETVYSGNLKGLLDYQVVDTNFDTTGHSDWYGEGQLIRVNSALRPTAGNDIQNKAVNFDLVFEATQTNNPGWNE